MADLELTRVQRWEQRSEIPLLLLALAFLVAYAWQVLDPRLSPGVLEYLEIVSWVVWAVFLIDFAARVFLADDRVRYAVTHWFDVLLIVLPMLRPLRLLRVLAFARILNRSATRSLIGKVTTYVGGTAVAALFLGALAILDVEQFAPDANIRSFGDALWWATTTITTVGYGDRYPVTTEGRFVAAALMLVGLAVVGVITASVAAWIVSNVRAEADASAAADTRSIAEPTAKERDV